MKRSGSGGERDVKRMADGGGCKQDALMIERDREWESEGGGGWGDNECSSTEVKAVVSH